MILITGANGQLGHDFQRLFDELKIEYVATDYKELDITNIEKIREFVKGENYTHIISCAAYNDVDKAESERELCYKLNTYAPRDMAIVAKEIGAIFVTYSTGFVFEGNKKVPYTEEDIPNPPSVYAKSKHEGEKQTLAAYEKTFVIRTSWVFGIANNNFNKQVIGWSKGRDKLNIVDDQVSVPTYSKDLAEFSWKLIESKEFGLYQLSNSGECSKYEQAKYVLESIGWRGELGTARTVDFNLPAKRSEYSKVSSEKAEKVIGEKMPSWQDAIDRFLEEINN
ncbi:dTDP-4-dehydrorhamnose reductase [Psychrilyobacter sp.]|uniref:dTDP-4-dehydrorhamnose reductase n=1 Tax=Psychrilyobacter sp. TaxID=2586924 RepID=UPI00301B2789